MYVYVCMCAYMYICDKNKNMAWIYNKCMTGVTAKKEGKEAGLQASNGGF